MWQAQAETNINFKLEFVKKKHDSLSFISFFSKLTWRGFVSDRDCGSTT